jgi:tRNA C32,U32 (ribose-2'-O)-methylase TrmJ
MNHEMKLGLQNYAITIPIDKSYVKFNNNKINSLQIYEISQNYRILHQVVQRLSQHNLKISNHRHIQKLRQRK